MKRIAIGCAAAMVATAAAAGAAFAGHDWDAPDVVPGAVLIRYTPERSTKIKERQMASGVAGLTLVPVDEPARRKLGAVAPDEEFEPLLPDVFVGTFDPAQRTGVLAALAADEAVVYFEPNRLRYAVPTWGTSTPTDGHFPWQWGMMRMGAPATWPYQPVECSTVRVAIIEGGGPFDDDNMELSNQVFAAGGDGRAPHDHGTGVAGVIAATANGTGVVGVANATIFAVDPGVDDSDFIVAFSFARAMQARVVNMSFKYVDCSQCPGGEPPCEGLSCSRYTPPSQAVQDAIRNAATSMVLVAAVGNDCRETDDLGQIPLPVGYTGVVGVAAIATNGSRAMFSNYGTYVDLTAPGVDIWTAGEITFPDTPPIQIGEGTSLSAPHVAGAAAAVLVVTNDYDVASIPRLLQLTSEDLGDAGRDDDYGWGLVRVDRAVEAIADVYVENGAAGSGTGTLLEPLTNVVAALDAVPAEGTVGFVKGTFSGSLTITNPCRLISVGGLASIGN